MSEQGKDKKNLYERALSRIRDNTDGARDKLLAPVVPKFPGATPAKLLQEARADAERRYARHIGADLARKAASTLTLEHVKEYLINKGRRTTMVSVGPRGGAPPSRKETQC